MKKQFVLLCMSVALIAGCKKDSDNNSTPNLTLQSDPQTFFKLDGQDVSVKTSDDITEAVSSSGSLNAFPDTSTKCYGTGFYNDATSADIFGIDVGYIEYVGSAIPTDAAFEALFTGSKTYVSEPCIANGVSIYYYINGVRWATNLGTGVQTGSTFTFTDQESSTGFGYTNTTVLANFNCTLYDGAGNSKVITNGAYVGTFENN